jgi:hypothetical protein
VRSKLHARADGRMETNDYIGATQRSKRIAHSPL